MGNQPSRDGGTLEKPGMQRSNSMKIANKRNNKNNPKTRSPPTSFTVSPVRHQLVLTNHVSPLVPLTDHLPRRRRSSSTRIMITRSTSPFQEDTSTDSMTSRDFLPIAGSPLSSSYNSRQSDEFSSMFESTGSHSSARNSKYKSDHLDHWIYDYGTEKERDRQTRQHYVLKQVFQNNIHVELATEPTCILESACGAGLWSVETAQTYPNCKVIGIDAVPPSEREGWHPHFSGVPESQTSNLVFKYGDIHRQLEFDDHSFDFVFQRDVATDVPQSLWPNLISEFGRVLKPGGQIELVEYDLLFKSPGPFLSQVNEWYQTAAKSIDVDPDYTLYIPEYLKESGFVDINEKIVDIPIGEWPSDDLQRQYGYLYKEQMKTLFKSFKRWWCVELKVSAQEYDKACMEALEEFDQQKCFARWKIFTATKPSCL